MRLPPYKTKPIKTLLSALTASTLLFSSLSYATIVRIETSAGDIDVNLFDRDTPKTVENFLNYVNDGAYDNTFIHRLVKNFVVQGGGYKFNANYTTTDKVGSTPHIQTLPAVVNEPLYSNKRGTIAMAKRAFAPNSATSEWYFNLKDNPHLDWDNSGYTVFGQVTEDSLEVLDTIQALNIVSFGSNTPFTDVPAIDYTQDDYKNKVSFDEQYRLMIYSVTIIDDDPDSAAELNPEEAVQPSAPAKKKKSGSFGSELLWMLAGLAFIRPARRFLKKA